MLKKIELAKKKEKEKFSCDLPSSFSCGLFHSLSCLSLSRLLSCVFPRLHTTLYGGDERLYLLRYGGDICLSFLKDSFRGQELRLILEKHHIPRQIEEIVLPKRRGGRKGRGENDGRRKGKEEKEKEDEESSSASSSSSTSLLSSSHPWCVWNFSDEARDQEILAKEIEQTEDEEREEGGDDRALVSAVVLLELSQWVLKRRKKKKRTRE